MKTIKFYLWVLLFVFVGIVYTSCSDKDDTDPIPPKPNPVEQNCHFDVWVTIGKPGGMGSDAPIVVKTNLTDLTTGNLDFKNNGVDVTATLYQESIIKGKYYYQIPQSGDRFGMYQLKNDKIENIWAFPFTTFEARKFTHCWVDDKTLVLMGASGKSDQILWAKIDTEAQKLTDEGIIDFSKYPEAFPTEYAEGKVETYNTSGILAYRKADDKIMYSFVFNKGNARNGASRGKFYMAFINPATMEVEAVAAEDRADMMSGTAYGELLQEKSFFDENGDYYLTCNSYIPGAPSTTQQKGALLRVKKGEKTFDKSYNGYTYESGKLISINYLGDGKSLLYIQDPIETGAEGWGNIFNCYYALLDLKTGVRTKLALPVSNGTFSQFATVVNNIAYIGVSPENGETAIWVYDIKKDELKKGMTMTNGFLARIIAIEEDAN